LADAEANKSFFIMDILLMILDIINRIRLIDQVNGLSILWTETLKILIHDFIFFVIIFIFYQL